MTKKIIFLLGLSIVLLYACQDNPVDEFYTGNQSLFSYNGNNNAGKSLLQKLEVQPSLKEETGRVLGEREEVLYNYASLRLGSVYGAYYLLPVRDKASGVVNRALVYKLNRGGTGEEGVSPDPFSGLVVLDTAELNRIPAYKRFLHSHPFKQWEERGLRVSPVMSEFAKKMEREFIKLTTLDLPDPVSKVLFTSVTISYELVFEGFEIMPDVEELLSRDLRVPALMSKLTVFDEAFNDQPALYHDEQFEFTLRMVGDDMITSPDWEDVLWDYLSECSALFTELNPYCTNTLWQISDPESDTSGGSGGGNNTPTPGGGDSGGGTITITPTPGGGDDNTPTIREVTFTITAQTTGAYAKVKPEYNSQDFYKVPLYRAKLSASGFSDIYYDVIRFGVKKNDAGVVRVVGLADAQTHVVSAWIPGYYSYAGASGNAWQITGDHLIHMGPRDIVSGCMAWGCIEICYSRMTEFNEKVLEYSGATSHGEIIQERKFIVKLEAASRPSLTSW